MRKVSLEDQNQNQNLSHSENQAKRSIGPNLDHVQVTEARKERRNIIEVVVGMINIGINLEIDLEIGQEIDQKIDQRIDQEIKERTRMIESKEGWVAVREVMI